MKVLLSINILFLYSFCLFSQGIDETNLLRLAQSYEAAGNIQKSYELFKELFQKNQHNDVYLDGYFRNLMNLKKFDEGIYVVRKRLEKSPWDYHFFGQLSVLYYKIDNIDSMKKTIDYALNLDQTNYLPYRLIANVLIENRLFDQALDVLERGRKNSEAKLVFHYDLANLYVSVMNYVKACEVLIDLITQDPNQYSFVEVRLASFISRPEGSEIAVKMFRDAYEDNVSAAIDKIYAWLLFEAKKFKEAFDVVVKLDKQNNSRGNELLSYAQRATNEKQFNVAIDAYNYLLKNYDNFPEVKALSIIGLARNYDAMLADSFTKPEIKWKKYFPPLSGNDNNASLASSYYEIILKDYKSSALIPEALYRLANIKFTYQNDIGSAKIFLQRILNEYPVNEYLIPAKLLLTDILMAEQEYDKAFNLNTEIITHPRTNEEQRYYCRYEQANILILKGNVDSAKSILTELSRNVKLDESNDVLETLFLLQESEEDKTDIVIFTQAKFDILAKRFDKAAEKLKNLTLRKNESGITSLGFLYLADMDILRGDYSSAISELQFVINQKGETIYGDRAYYRLGELYLYGLNNKQSSVKAFEDLLAEYPNSILANSARKIINEIKINTLN